MNNEHQSNMSLSQNLNDVRKDLVALELAQSSATATMWNHLSTWLLQSHTLLALKPHDNSDYEQLVIL